MQNSFLQRSTASIVTTCRRAAAIVLFVAVAPAWSAGGRDASFGDGGQQIVDNLSIGASVLQPDGKILLAGTRSVAPDSADIVVTRLLENGDIDTGFGTAGRVQVDVDGRFDVVNAIAVQADGRIVVAGGSAPDSISGAPDRGTVIRLNVDGSLDAAFGANGRFIDSTGHLLVFRAIAVQADGRIVAVGDAKRDDLPATDVDLLALRLNANGTLDKGFGNQGVRILDWMQRNDAAYDVALQSDGAILMAGSAGESLHSYGRNSKIAVVRLLSDGAVDLGFAQAGWWVYSPTESASTEAGATANRVFAQSDGRIVVVGDADHNLGTREDGAYGFPGVLRLDPNGALDADYGEAGNLWPLFNNVNSSNIDGLRSAQIAQDGSIWLAPAAPLAVARFSPQGVLDSSVGQSGIAFLEARTASAISSFDVAPVVLVTAQNRVLVAANVATSDHPESGIVVRYRGDDPPAGTVGFDVTQLSLDETATVANLIVHRTGGSQGSVSVQFRTVDGYALAGQDYTTASGQLDWPDGDVGDRTVAIPLLSNSSNPSRMGGYVEFDVQLTTQRSNIALGVSSARVVLAPVEQAPPPPPPPAAAEGGSGAMDLGLIGIMMSILILRAHRRGMGRLWRDRIAAPFGAAYASRTRPRDILDNSPNLLLAGLCASSLSLLFVQAATATTTRWVSVGPAPASITAAIAADAASRTIYIGSLGRIGVLKSTDGGAHFAPVNNGLESADVGAMAMAPNNPDIVYLGGGSGVIYKTVDGGASWHATAESSGVGVVALAMDPSDSDIVYAGSAKGAGVWKTSDGGESWSPASEGMGGEPSVFSIVVDPRDTHVLYAGTLGSGAFKSTDGAATWTALDIDSTVQALLVDPIYSNVVYAGTNGKGVYKSTDSGQSFARVGSPEVGVVLSLAKSGRRLFAGTAGHGVSVSSDGGATWRNTGVTAGLATGLSVDGNGAVYLSTNFDGAFVLPPMQRGDDEHGFRDTSWHRLAWRQLQRCACQAGDAIAIDPSDGNHVFMGTVDGGLLVTQDGGRTWTDGGTEGLTTRTPVSIAFDPQQPRYVYAGSFTGSGFFKSEDQGKHWTRRLFGSSAVFSTGIAVDPVDHSVYVATASGDGLWKSNDRGNTFSRIDRAPGAAADEYLDLSGRGVTVDQRHHRIVFAASSRRNPGIWRSTDAGRSWIKVDSNAAFSVTVDPTDSSIVFAGTAELGVLKSVDGGLSFRMKTNGLPDEALFTSITSGVQVNPARHNVLYIGTDAGVFKSIDGAESWTEANLGLDDTFSPALALDPASPDTLYAATASSAYKTITSHR